MFMAVVLFAMLQPGPTVKDRGQLAAAVAGAANQAGPVQDRIATDRNHAAQVTDTSVTWFDQTGHQFVTATSSAHDTLQLFDSKNFTNYSQNTSPSTAALVTSLIGPLATVFLVIFLLRFLRKGTPGMGLRKSGAREIASDSTGVTFADVAGCDEARLELEEIVTILKHPERFATLGARTPKGVILSGAPGTGKTLLAKAVAGEAGVPFFAASGSEFVELFVGVGASRVRDLFAQARLKAPAILFIDEVDAVGRRRSSGGGQGNQEYEQTLNQLLVEMDGIDTAAPVIVIAATNRADMLDPALIRPGRFDRQVTVDLPDLRGRKAILEVHARNKPLIGEVDLGVVAKQTPGFSGADLANVINEAAILAARRDSAQISMADIESACMRVMAGPERAHSLLNEHERRVVAYHEIGHALVGHVLPNADPIHRVSIVSRGRALGWTMQLPERDHVLSSRNQLTDRLAGLLGGRMAEEIVFGPDEITSGAADDIEKATHIAHQMVTALGMSPLGLRAFMAADPGQPRTYSEETAGAIDLEIDRLLEEAAERARVVLRDRRQTLEALAARLVEVETINADELASIIDRYPHSEVPRATIISLPPRTRREGGTRSHAALQGADDPGVAAMTAGTRRRGNGLTGMRRTSQALLRLFRGIPLDG